ncbi:Long-chain-fatty-acid--CoA ligase [Crocosphaera watsonii WH 0401]|uniref:Long-chain-fatty-acid--CoA ligase n=1 Tax=Crocosphaera watsonii WH 0401 TaxID=555881 RepID=T2JDE7_CROWT|nr:Long-chain-fatty-acid--CoA ligase [Crocosphaera watsonii WH 0401]
MASHESFCKNLVDYFRQAALGTLQFLTLRALRGANNSVHTEYEF